MITQFYTPLPVSNQQCKFNVNEYAYNLRTKRYHEILALLAPGMIRQFKNQQGHGKVLVLNNGVNIVNEDPVGFWGQVLTVDVSTDAAKDWIISENTSAGFKNVQRVGLIDYDTIIKDKFIERTGLTYKADKPGFHTSIEKDYVFNSLRQQMAMRGDPEQRVHLLLHCTDVKVYAGSSIFTDCLKAVEKSMELHLEELMMIEAECLVFSVKV